MPVAPQINTAIGAGTLVEDGVLPMARPGGRRMICLEEMDDARWGLERRLHRPQDIGCRVLQGGDNRVAVSASVKGCASCKLLHTMCRKMMAIINLDFCIL